MSKITYALPAFAGHITSLLLKEIESINFSVKLIVGTLSPKYLT